MTKNIHDLMVEKIYEQIVANVDPSTSTDHTGITQIYMGRMAGKSMAILEACEKARQQGIAIVVNPPRFHGLSAVREIYFKWKELSAYFPYACSYAHLIPKLPSRLSQPNKYKEVPLCEISPITHKNNQT